MTISNIAARWRELSGENKWKGLLDPIDPDLRRYLIHYIQRGVAAADAFNGTKASRGYALSLYPPDEFFTRVGLELGNPFKYKLTNFIYAATGNSSDHAFIGYVAVATDEGKAVLGRRDILVAWRGTMTEAEWAEDVNIKQTSAENLFPHAILPELAMVHHGFYSIYTDKVQGSTYVKTSARDQARKAVKELVDQYQNEEVSITVTGHSMGGALATLNAMDIAHNNDNKPTGNSNKSFMVTAFASGCPRVGNLAFMGVFNSLSDDLHLLRVVNASDLVPMVPGIEFGYVHVGVELGIEATKSPYLKLNFNNFHSSEIYQLAIAGQQENGKFKLEEELDFDYKIVNKHGDDLRDEYKIPDKWWTQEKFKDMVQMDDGHWKFEDSAYVPNPPSA